MNDNDTGAMNATDHHKETEMNDDRDLAAEYEALTLPDWSETFLSSADGIMLCPLCHGSHTHVDLVLVQGRDGKDNHRVFAHVHADGKLHHGGISGIGRPPERFPLAMSPERHAFGLAGYCEDCARGFVLEFVQHKGSTYVAAVEAPSAVPENVAEGWAQYEAVKKATQS